MKDIIFSLLLAGVGAIPALQVNAADVRVITNPAYRPALDEMAPVWEKSTGNRVIIEQAIPAQMLERLGRGEVYDIAIANTPLVKRLEQEDKFVAPASIGSVGVSIAIRTGAPKPDISTAAAFKAAMSNAKAISTVDPNAINSSGHYMMQVFDRLGITAEVKPKLVIVYGGSAAEPIEDGRAEIALQQTSELIGRPKVTVIGPLPAELQQRWIYLAGLNPAASEPAKAFQAFLAGPQTRAVLEKKADQLGMGPP